MLLDLFKGKKDKKEIIDESAEVIRLKSVDSTNEYLKRDVDDGRIKFCIAEQQTQGKGRMGRVWFSPMSENIYLSCRYPLKKHADELSGLSLVVGLAAYQVLQEAGITQNLALKWPNDIICQAKKLGGVLIELQKGLDDTVNAIIGIGINANMTDDQQAISQPWISMRQVLQREIDRELITGMLINGLLANLKKFSEQGFLPFVEEWKQADYLLGKQIKVESVGEIVEGEAMGVDLHGQLLLRTQEGTTKSLVAGETSIVKK